MRNQLKITITNISTSCEVSGVEKNDIIATLATAIDEICQQNDIPIDTVVAAILLAKKLKSENQCR